MTAKPNDYLAMRARQVAYAKEIAHAQWRGADECINAGGGTEIDKAIVKADDNVGAEYGETQAGLAGRIFLFPPETDAPSRAGWRQLREGDKPSLEWDDLTSLEWAWPEWWEPDTETDAPCLFAYFEWHFRPVTGESHWTDTRALLLRYTSEIAPHTPQWDAVAAAVQLYPLYPYQCEGWTRDPETGAVREWHWFGNEDLDAAAAAAE